MSKEKIPVQHQKPKYVTNPMVIKITVSIERSLADFNFIKKIKHLQIIN